MTAWFGLKASSWFGALAAYLRQLDGRPESTGSQIIFVDNFESGNTSAWTQVVGP